MIERMGKKNVLLFLGKIDLGGIENLYLNVIPLLKQNCDFFLTCYVDGENELEQDFLDLGCSVHRFSVNRYLHPIKFINLIREYIRANNIDVVHCNVGYSCFYALIAAYLERVPVRIAHSHSTEFGNKRNPLNKAFEIICKISCHFFATKRVNIGELSARGLFLKRDTSVFIPNGINLKRFSFSPTARALIREKLSIAPDSLVLLCVGRLDKVKNHSFLIDLFEEICRENQNCYLLIVGSGSLKDDIESKVKGADLSNKVFMFEGITNLEDYYSASDVLVMPSHREGFSLAMIEAQASGLQCYTSTNVDPAIRITDKMHFLPLDGGVSLWAGAISATVERERDEVPDPNLNRCDIAETAKAFLDLYEGK